VNDTHALADMALDAKELLGVETMNTLTDKGYTTGVQIDTCTKNITTYSSPKAHSSQKNGLFDMQIFVYNKKKTPIPVRREPYLQPMVVFTKKETTE
jgi:hypothetical protein